MSRVSDVEPARDAFLLPLQFEHDLARSLGSIEDLVALGLAARTPT
jgi:hypothetical protein